MVALYQLKTVVEFVVTVIVVPVFCFFTTISCVVLCLNCKDFVMCMYNHKCFYKSIYRILFQLKQFLKYIHV